MRLVSLFSGLMGSMFGFAAGGIYLFYTSSPLATKSDFFFQIPAPIYLEPMWWLGAGAIILAFLGLIGSIFSISRPKLAFIILAVSSFLGLGIIFAGYLLSSICFFVGSLISLLEYRKNEKKLDLGRVFFPSLVKTKKKSNRQLEKELLNKVYQAATSGSQSSSWNSPESSS